MAILLELLFPYPAIASDYIAAHFPQDLLSKSFHLIMAMQKFYQVLWLQIFRVKASVGARAVILDSLDEAG